MKIFTLTVILLSSLSVFCQTLEENSRELWTVFTAGDFVNQNAHKIVTKDWPFKVKSKGGDVLDSLLIDKVEKNNAIIWKKLEAEGYNNPKENYYNQIKSEIRNIDKIIELINENKFLDRKMNGIIESKRIKLPELTKINDSLYQFNMSSVQLSDIDSTEKIEFKIVGNIYSDELFILCEGE
ncbi:hypothetical protein LDL76_15595 [Salegentibacter mishustinae]|jgi:hypothetical protein|uniref:hypothetical protein n=1 Tax=Salegentibacter mishustinae TaxID=270918 RepID=UPI001CE03A13|nr:hypothetical protein [Salegentibacter mishustinae]UBZ06767.1 hypothetical protein LDL76_15595 [Salegentibacter mishustinae]|tara:strand:+ start:97 stop:642 length:546 start_codon:yes stop_codon:yes gene_type:complete